MANTLYPPPRPQSVGEILDSAFRIFRATLVQCLPYAIAAVIAGQLPNIYYLVSGEVYARAQALFEEEQDVLGMYPHLAELDPEDWQDRVEQ